MCSGLLSAHLMVSTCTTSLKWLTSVSMMSEWCVHILHFLIIRLRLLSKLGWNFFFLSPFVLDSGSLTLKFPNTFIYSKSLPGQFYVVDVVVLRVQGSSLSSLQKLLHYVIEVLGR